jgi:hypothetical protein
VVAAFVLAALASGTARAEGPPRDDAVWRVRSTGRLTVDGGLVLGLPTVLDTGLATGLGGGVMFGHTLSFGVRASWASATESSLAWTVTHMDVRLRAAVAIARDAGRGRFALRLGLGPTFVDENRVRNQGMRAGLTGSALQTSAFDAVPTADLEAVVAVHIAGPWLLMVSGGPSVSIEGGAARAGWTAQLGTGWQP